MTDSWPPRFVIIGACGAGKSTFAQALGEMLDIPVIDLDALYWGPNWTPVPVEVFRQRVEQHIQSSAWIVVGNYSAVRDILWSQARALVWLDYPFRVVFWRLWTRTQRNIRLKQPLWGNNQETWRHVLGRGSIFLWLFKTFTRYHSILTDLLRQSAYQHLKIHRLRSPGETESWLRKIKNF